MAASAPNPKPSILNPSRTHLLGTGSSQQQVTLLLSYFLQTCPASPCPSMHKACDGPPCIPRPSLQRGAGAAEEGAAVGNMPTELTCTPSVCLDFPHMVVRVEGSPFQKGAPPMSTSLPDTVSCFQTEATFPQGGTGPDPGATHRRGPHPQPSADC